MGQLLYWGPSRKDLGWLFSLHCELRHKNWYAQWWSRGPSLSQVKFYWSLVLGCVEFQQNVDLLRCLIMQSFSLAWVTMNTGKNVTDNPQQDTMHETWGACKTWNKDMGLCRIQVFLLWGSKTETLISKFVNNSLSFLIYGVSFYHVK